MKARRIAELGVLTGIALILFIVELRLPELTPVPGVKLGLANIVTVFCVFRYKPQETAALVVSRILLGAVFAGNPAALLYSAAGAVLCLTGMLLAKPILSDRQIWLASVLGAVLHNVGQIIAAAFVMSEVSPSILLRYLAVLMAVALVTGAATGVLAREIINRLRHVVDRRMGR